MTAVDQGYVATSTSTAAGQLQAESVLEYKKNNVSGLSRAQEPALEYKKNNEWGLSRAQELAREKPGFHPKQIDDHATLILTNKLHCCMLEKPTVRNPHCVGMFGGRRNGASWDVLVSRVSKPKPKTK